MAELCLIKAKLFQLLHSKYQVTLKISITESDFIFDSVQLMYYKCHTTNFIHGGSYIETPDLVKKVAINQKNTDDKFFQYAATAALSYEVIGSHPERFQLLKP